MPKESERAKETYASAGVDIDAATRAKELIKERARTTFRPEVLTGIGAFAGLFQLHGYGEPVLVSSVDGVGTKIRIAIALDRHDTVGMDLVNHCVNDIFTCGAHPLFFLDYIAMGKLVPEQVSDIVRGLAQACGDAGCALIGGETAEMPGIYAPGDYDLAGFIVGVVEKSRVVQKGLVRAGDAILAVPSSGLHTNGYSLVRRVFDLDGNSGALNVFYPELGRTLGEELLEPHRCYYRLLEPVLSAWGPGGREGHEVVRAMAHITGGGIPDNVARILTDEVTAVFQCRNWEVPAVFRLIQGTGNVDAREMYHVFNMGIGMVLICSPAHVETVRSSVPEARVVGEVVERKGRESVVLA